MNKFVIFILCLLYSNSVFAGCLSKAAIATELAEFDRVESSVRDTSKLKAILISILNKLNEDCLKSNSNELFEFVMEAFAELGSAVPTKARYDSVIVGGGIAGTAAALAIDEAHSVLVIEKNRWPSIFGHAGSFYLNTEFESGFRLQNSPFFVNQFASLPLFMGRYREAQSLGRNLLLNLFVSGAQVLLDTEVDRIEPLSETTFELKTKKGQHYSSDHVIVATGQVGINIESFEDSPLILNELSKPNGQIETVESLYVKVRENPRFLESIRGQDVAIIGGNDGGRAALLAILGMFPGSEFQTSIPTHGKIHWIGGKLSETDKVYPALKNNTDHFFQYGTRATRLSAHSEKIIITLESQEQVEVSHVFLATGYTKYLDQMIPEASLGDDQKGLNIIGSAKFYNLGSKPPGMYAYRHDEAGANKGREINESLKVRKDLQDQSVEKDQRQSQNQRWIDKISYFKRLK